MTRRMRRMMLWLSVSCMMLTACGGGGQHDSTVGESTQETSAETGSLTDVPFVEVTDASVAYDGNLDKVEESTQEGTEMRGERIAFAGGGSTRVTYNGNENWVRYVTSKAELPAGAGLEKYDNNFFETKALVLVKVTVTSGSTKVGIQSITRKDDLISVKLSYQSPEVGTTDMATLLLWVEVDTGLQGYQWEIVNPAVKPNPNSDSNHQIR